MRSVTRIEPRQRITWRGSGDNGKRAGKGGVVGERADGQESRRAPYCRRPFRTVRAQRLRRGVVVAALVVVVVVVV